MADKSDKLLQDSESEIVQSGNGLTFCVSPPPRRITQNGGEQIKELCNESRHMKTAHDEGREAKYEAFCISPPGRNADKISKPHIVQKLRNGRMNAIKSIQRLPIRADHNTGHDLTAELKNTNHSSLETENDNLPISAPSTADDGNITKSDNITENTVGENEMQKESMLEMLKLCSKNCMEIGKLRKDVIGAKSDILRSFEEEEKWKCRYEMQDNKTRANQTKINNLKREKTYLFSKPGERELNIDDLKAHLMKCRTDLIYHLSETQKVMQKAVSEKTKERRQLGTSYPKWLLPDFHEEYQRYREMHGFAPTFLEGTSTPCPVIDMATFVQKRKDNAKKYVKILIDGRQFNFKKIGLTQVLGTLYEDDYLQGKFNIVIPETTSKKDNEAMLRKPQTTSIIDVKAIIDKGCSDSLMSYVDGRIAVVSTISFRPNIKTGKDAEISLNEIDMPKQQVSQQSFIPHPPMTPNTVDKSMIEWKTKTTHMLPSRRCTPSPRCAPSPRRTPSPRCAPSPRCTPSPCFDTSSITLCKNVQKTKRERGNFHSASGVRTVNDTIIGHSESAGSVFASHKNTNIKEFKTRRQGGFQSYENCDTFLMSGDDKYSPKLDKVKTVGIKRNGMMVERFGPKVLPPIRKSKQKPLVDGGIKHKTNITTNAGSFSMVCKQNMVPVKVLHKDSRNNKMVYLTALIKKENIMPFSITRQGSHIPIRLKYLKNLPQFGRTSSITKTIPFAVPRQCLDTIKEVSNEFDDNSPEPDEITSNQVPTFSQDRSDRSNSANGFNKAEGSKCPLNENDLVSNSNESLECKDMRPIDMSSEIEKPRTMERELSVTSFGFTPEYNQTTNVDEVHAVLNLNDERGLEPMINESEMFIPVCESENLQDAVEINAESSSRKSVGRTEELPSNTKPSDDSFDCKSCHSLENDLIGNGQNEIVKNPFLSEEIMSLATPPGTQNPGSIQSPKPWEILDGIGLWSPPESTRSLQKTPVMPKISRIPVRCHANLDTKRCTPVRLYVMTTCNCQDSCGSSSNKEYSKLPGIPSVNGNMSSGSQVFEPHPPKQKKPTLVSKINRFFSRNTKCCFK